MVVCDVIYVEGKILKRMFFSMVWEAQLLFSCYQMDKGVTKAVLTHLFNYSCCNMKKAFIEKLFRIKNHC